MKKLCLTLVLLCASLAAQADSSPAQAGYCEQFLRSTLVMIEKPMEYPTPQLVAMQRENGARLRLVIEQWRQYIRSLLVTAPLDGSVELELLRGKRQAQSDQTYSVSTADMNACQSASDGGACLGSRDPVYEGMRQRAHPCMQGPGL